MVTEVGRYIILLADSVSFYWMDALSLLLCGFSWLWIFLGSSERF